MVFYKCMLEMVEQISATLVDGNAVTGALIGDVNHDQLQRESHMVGSAAVTVR